MTNVSGSFSGSVVTQTLMSPYHQTGQQLQLAEVRGRQQSPDADWNDARLTYWGFADLLAGSGSQRGHYVNEHPGGDRDYGTFEGKVSVSGNDVVLEGTFTFAGGTGRYQGIRGKGTYRGRMISATEIEMSWSGAYELAAAGQAA